MCRLKDGKLTSCYDKKVAALNSYVYFITGIVETKPIITLKKRLVKDKLKVKEKNVVAGQLIPRDTIIFLPLQIKFGLMKLFGKALNKDSKCIHIFF